MLNPTRTITIIALLLTAAVAIFFLFPRPTPSGHSSARLRRDDAGPQAASKPTPLLPSRRIVDQSVGARAQRPELQAEIDSARRAEIIAESMAKWRQWNYGRLEAERAALAAVAKSQEELQSLLSGDIGAFEASLKPAELAQIEDEVNSLMDRLGGKSTLPAEHERRLYRISILRRRWLQSILGEDRYIEYLLDWDRRKRMIDAFQSTSVENDDAPDAPDASGDHSQADIP